MQEIEFSPTVELVGGWAMYGCDSLKKVVFGESVMSIGENALDNLNGYAPDTVTIKNAKCVVNDGLGLLGMNTLGAVKKTVIYAPEDSYAHEFAAEKGYQFKALSVTTTTTTKPTTTTTTTTTKKPTTTTTTTTTKKPTTTTTTTTKPTTTKPTTTTTTTTTKPNTLQYGDVNCDGVVNVTDVTVLAAYLKGLKNDLLAQGLINADVCDPGDGVDEKDLEFLKGYVENKNSLPYYTIKIIKMGDVNSDDLIDARDASEVLTYYAKTSAGGKSTLANSSAADVNSDKVVDGRDASTILAYYAVASIGYDGTVNDFIKNS